MDKSQRINVLKDMHESGVTIEYRHPVGDWVECRFDDIDYSCQGEYRPVDQVQNWEELVEAKLAGYPIKWGHNFRGQSDNECAYSMATDDWNFDNIYVFKVIGDFTPSAPAEPSLGDRIHEAVILLNRHGYVVSRT